MTTYLLNTFSPMMIAPDTGKRKAITFKLMEVELSDIIKVLNEKHFISAVSHEKTAELLSSLIGKPVSFNRCDIRLKTGDKALVIIPDIRTGFARELTGQELMNAPILCFIIENQ